MRATLPEIETTPPVPPIRDRFSVLEITSPAMVILPPAAWAPASVLSIATFVISVTVPVRLVAPGALVMLPLRSIRDPDAATPFRGVMLPRAPPKVTVPIPAVTVSALAPSMVEEKLILAPAPPFTELKPVVAFRVIGPIILIRPFCVLMLPFIEMVLAVTEKGPRGVVAPTVLREMAPKGAFRDTVCPPGVVPSRVAAPANEILFAPVLVKVVEEFVRVVGWAKLIPAAVMSPPMEQLPPPVWANEPPALMSAPTTVVKGAELTIVILPNGADIAVPTKLIFIVAALRAIDVPAPDANKGPL